MESVRTITPYYGDIIDSARKLALAEHAKHCHGALPYSYHLVAVTGVVSCYSNDPDVIAAAWLHDIVEDCGDIDLDVVEAMTNQRVRNIVDRLTDPPGPRSLSKQISLPRIAACSDASLIKIADRFHNQASTLLDRSEKYAKMYVKEFHDFQVTFFDKWGRHPLFVSLMDQYKPLRDLAKG